MSSRFFIDRPIFAWVIAPDHQVAQRAVKLGGARGSNQWVVLEGLKPGEQVVVDGFQKIRPQAPVTPVPWSPASAASAGAGQAASAAAPSASAASR